MARKTLGDHGMLAAARPARALAKQGRAALRSLFEDITPSGADSVDLYFGPAEPAQAGGRWLHDVAQRAPDGFEKISDVLSQAELDAITAAYRQTTEA